MLPKLTSRSFKYCPDSEDKNENGVYLFFDITLCLPEAVFLSFSRVYQSSKTTTNKPKLWSGYKSKRGCLKSRQPLFLYTVATSAWKSSPNATQFFLTLFSLCFSGVAERLPLVVERSSPFFRKTLQKIS